MKVQVRWFSFLRDRAGTTGTQLDLPPGATLGVALGELRRRHAFLEEVYATDPTLVLTSVNREYADASKPLQDGDEIALFPPVSGGSGEGRHGLLLLSGGFDSPVAGQLSLEQGQRLDAVHFTMEPFTDDASARKSVELARILGIPRLTIVPIGNELAVFSRQCDPQCYFVLQKRLMVRLAETFARRWGAEFLLTGENLGQVSSQTLLNLGSIDVVSGLPILRPLLGLDKTDIINRARKIGTFETSKGPEVCDVLGPKHPSTAVSQGRVEAEERRVDVSALMAAALARARDVDTSKPYEAPAAALRTVPITRP